MKDSTKPTDFAYMLSKFLSQHLTGQRNLSPNTVLAYRDTLKLLLVFMKDEKHLAPDKVTLNDLGRPLVAAYLNWLKDSRGNSITTCNQRLGAVHSFFEFVQYEMPDKLQLCQEIMGIKAMRTPQSIINYLTLDGIEAILSMPDLNTRSGRRDVTMLSVLYDTGARVQELADITVGDVRFAAPATMRLVGKGNKARIVPLLHGTEALLKEYMRDLPEQPLTEINRPLFRNRGQEKFTRGGIAYLLKKYADAARKAYPGIIPDRLSPHCFRHSKAMHLLQADVNLIYIRDLLGHTDIKTTEIYARADSAAKRKALEKTNPNKHSAQFPSWTEDSGLMGWLQNFGR
jgi:site-specific recombinase XerD